MMCGLIAKVTHTFSLPTDVCEDVCVRARPHPPEPNDGAFLADVALGLVLGCLRGSHAVQHRQPHHRLRLQAHPVQEHGRLQLRLVVGLETETEKCNGGKEIGEILDEVLSAKIHLLTLLP